MPGTPHAFAIDRNRVTHPALFRIEPRREPGIHLIGVHLLQNAADGGFAGHFVGSPPAAAAEQGPLFGRKP